MNVQPFFYSQQIERYLIQFTNIFTGFQVNVGNGPDKKLITVPAMYGSVDKVVASVYAGNTQNKPIRVPVISTFMTGIAMAPHLFKGTGQETRQSYLPSGGMLPDDVEVIHRYVPIPYTLQADAYILVSNQQMQMQMLEQTLMLFDPTLLIQTNDNTFDWTRLSYVELKSISLEEAFPEGGNERTLMVRLSFEFPIWITPPAKRKDDFVKKIMVRVGVADEMNPEAVVDFFDGVPLDYITVADADKLFKPIE